MDLSAVSLQGVTMQQQQPPHQGYPQQGNPQVGFPPQGGYVPQQHPYGWGPQTGQQSFGWGAPVGPGPGPGWRPPRRRGAGPIIAVIGVLAVLLIGGVILIALLSRDNGSTRTVQPRPTFRSTTSTKPPIPTYSGTVTTSQPTQPPQATETRPTVPPPKPRLKPKPSPTPRQVLTGSRIYRTGTHPALGCHEPGVRPTSVQNVIAYDNAMKACLDRAWPRQERAGGFQVRLPRMIHFNGPVSTPCSGGVTQRSFYCSANEMIYMYVTEPMKTYREWGASAGATGRMVARMRMLHVMAHEYGHHVQNVTGILGAYHELRYQASNQGALFLSRQTELQASCFAAVFVGANRSSLPVTGFARKQWDWLVAHSGDLPGYPRDHGSLINHTFWSKRGFSGRSPGVCRVFSASPRFSS